MKWTAELSWSSKDELLRCYSTSRIIKKRSLASQFLQTLNEGAERNSFEFVKQAWEEYKWTSLSYETLKIKIIELREKLGLPEIMIFNTLLDTYSCHACGSACKISENTLHQCLHCQARMCCKKECLWSFLNVNVSNACSRCARLCACSGGAFPCQDFIKGTGQITTAVLKELCERFGGTSEQFVEKLMKSFSSTTHREPAILDDVLLLTHFNRLCAPVSENEAKLRNVLEELPVASLKVVTRTLKINAGTTQVPIVRYLLAHWDDVRQRLRTEMHAAGLTTS